MSLVIRRNPGQSFVIIDEKDPSSFSLVTIRGGGGVEIDAPKTVHIIRREILHRYAVHKDVLTEVELIEGERR